MLYVERWKFSELLDTWFFHYQVPTYFRTRPLWVTGMDLQDEKGTYVLIASVPKMKAHLRVLANWSVRYIVPRFYAYVGSAFGAGGLGGRIGHHLESTASPHWHIDYLLQLAQPVQGSGTRPQTKNSNATGPNSWRKASQFRIPIPRFGSSDHHRSRSSHLFYSKRRPRLWRGFNNSLWNGLRTSTRNVW